MLITAIKSLEQYLPCAWDSKQSLWVQLLLIYYCPLPVLLRTGGVSMIGCISSGTSPQRTVFFPLISTNFAHDLVI